MEAEVVQWLFRLFLLLILQVWLLCLQVWGQGGTCVPPRLTRALQDGRPNKTTSPAARVQRRRRRRERRTRGVSGSPGTRLRIWRGRRPQRRSEATQTRGGRRRSVSSPAESTRSQRSRTTATPAGTEGEHDQQQVTDMEQQGGAAKMSFQCARDTAVPVSSSPAVRPFLFK